MNEFKNGCLKLNGEVCPHGFNEWCRACADALKPRGRLATAVTDLAEALEFARADIAKSTELFGHGYKAWQMRDQNGRYVLLDAQAALVSGLAAMVNGEGSTHVTQV